MNILSSNGRISINVGGYEMWQALCSTVFVNLHELEPKAKLAFAFLNTGKCKAADCLETARQFNLIRDNLARFTPDKMVYDHTDLTKKAPWANNISTTITSCANYFVSGDGYDLLAEIVRILSYSFYTKGDVFIS